MGILWLSVCFFDYLASNRNEKLNALRKGKLKIFYFFFFGAQWNRAKEPQVFWSLQLRVRDKLLPFNSLVRAVYRLFTKERTKASRAAQKSLRSMKN